MHNVVPKVETLQMRNWTETCSLPRRLTYLTWIKIPKTAPYSEAWRQWLLLQVFVEAVPQFRQFFNQPLWIHALMNNHAQFFETLGKVCFFWFWFCCRLNTKNQGVGCTFEYQNFCKVGVCFDLIDTRHKEQTWWVPSVFRCGCTWIFQIQFCFLTFTCDV